jgi:ribosomal protein S18 acetylase RimI-like enzyme
MTDSTDILSEARAAAEQAGVSIREASQADLDLAVSVQHGGFSRMALTLGIDPLDLPPVRETLDEVRRLHEEGMRVFIAVVPSDGGERVVGTVRGLLRDDATVEIGRLAVDDEFLRRGIARALMLGLEAAFPNACRFELYTGSEATGPLALYAQLGYRIYAREHFEEWTLVRLEKDAPACVDAR